MGLFGWTPRSSTDEASLKQEFALEVTMAMQAEQLRSLYKRISTELPNGFVQSSSGLFHLTGHPQSIPVDFKSFLLRWSKLRKVD